MSAADPSVGRRLGGALAVGWLGNALGLETGLAVARRFGLADVEHRAEVDRRRGCWCRQSGRGGG
jgi:hypothetical protein